MMRLPSPTVRGILGQVDRALSGPLEQLTAHHRVGAGLTVVSRGAAMARVQGEVWSRRAWHALNLPAASDINRLLAHIASVEREVRVLQLSSATLPTPRRPREADRSSHREAVTSSEES